MIHGFLKKTGDPKPERSIGMGDERTHIPAAMRWFNGSNSIYYSSNGWIKTDERNELARSREGNGKQRPEWQDGY